MYNLITICLAHCKNCRVFTIFWKCRISLWLSIILSKLNFSYFLLVYIGKSGLNLEWILDFVSKNLRFVHNNAFRPTLFMWCFLHRFIIAHTFFLDWGHLQVLEAFRYDYFIRADLNIHKGLRSRWFWLQHHIRKPSWWFFAIPYHWGVKLIWRKSKEIAFALFIQKLAKLTIKIFFCFIEFAIAWFHKHGGRKNLVHEGLRFNY